MPIGSEKTQRIIAALVLALSGLAGLGISLINTGSIGFAGITLGMVMGALLVYYAWKVWKSGKVTGRMA